jgi:hypothetical protein
MSAIEILLSEEKTEYLTNFAWAVLGFNPDLHADKSALSRCFTLNMVRYVTVSDTLNFE